MNYFLENPVKSTIQEVEIDYDKNDTVINIKKFGSGNAICSYDMVSSCTCSETLPSTGVTPHPPPAKNDD